MKQWIWSGKPWQAFKNFAILFSFAMNLVLLIVLTVAAVLIIPVINGVAIPIVGGLNQSFVDMGQAHIVRAIQVDDEIPISFELPVTMETQATITEQVPMALPTSFMLPGGGGTINGTVHFELPQGVALPIQLDMVVPVSQTVPISLDVAVDIPLSETELGQPFSNLQAIFTPLDRFLSNLPSSNGEMYERLVNSVTTAGQDSSIEQASSR